MLEDAIRAARTRSGRTKRSAVKYLRITRWEDEATFLAICVAPHIAVAEMSERKKGVSGDRERRSPCAFRERTLPDFKIA